VDLSVRYGGVSAVHGVSIEVGPGEAVGIIGANGAGKTSTLKAILGLAPRSARRIRFDGQDLLRTPARNVVRCGIGYVPEGRHVFSPLSVEKNLLLGAYTRRWDQQTRASLGEVYEIFPVLGEMRARQAGTLSGGAAADAGDRPGSHFTSADAGPRRALDEAVADPGHVNPHRAPASQGPGS
jgi:branched-chain amino acid transport system ATP-binding protein